MKVDKKWLTKSGLMAVVITTEMGHHCGYVGVEKGHPLYGLDYQDKCDLLIPIKDDEPVGSRGIMSIIGVDDGYEKQIDMVFDVHGSITYSGAGKGTYPIESKLWWFGYDCAHCYDTPKNCNLDFCINECERLAKQIVEKTKLN